MSDLWVSASTDVEAENLDRHLTSARIASAAVWPFLAAATSEVEYANRKALVADRIDRVAAAVAENDPALFSVVRASLEDGFDQDFAVLHADRVATARIEASKTKARLEAEASIKAQAEREVLEKVLAAGLDNLGDAKAEPFGKDDDEDEGIDYDSDPDDPHYGENAKADRQSDKEASKTAATDGDTSTCKNCGKPVEYVETAWVHTPSDNIRCQGDEGYVTELKNTVAEPKTATFDPVKAGHVRCKSCKHQFRAPKGLGAERCPKCKSSDLQSNASKTAARECKWTRVSEVGEDDGLTWYECSTHGKTEMGDGANPPQFPCEGWLDENSAENPYKGSRNKTAAFPPAKDGNPFGSKKPADDADAGSPDHNADQQGGSWQCPQCGSANAYTQGGVDLDEALKAKQPIQCGDCKQVDSTGGSAGTQDANGAPKQDQPSPGAPPVHASSLPFGSTNRYGFNTTSTSGAQGVTVTYVSTTHPMVTATTSHTAAPFQPGIPDDMTDGPHLPGASQPMAAPPQSTRPRVMPDAPAPAVDATPAPPTSAPAPDTAAGADPKPAPKKAAGLGFTSAAFKTAADSQWDLGYADGVGDAREGQPKAGPDVEGTGPIDLGYWSGYDSGYSEEKSGVAVLPGETRILSSRKTALGDDKCPEQDEHGGDCTYREGHDAPHRFEGGDDDARHQDALDTLKKEKS